jgi:hypothetical protein
MSAKRHATVLNVMMVIAVIGAFGLFLAHLNLIVPGIIYALVWGTVLFLVPVRCCNHGCTERMKRTFAEENEGLFTKQLHDTCSICGDSYDGTIIIVTIEVSS